MTIQREFSSLELLDRLLTPSSSELPVENSLERIRELSCTCLIFHSRSRSLRESRLNFTTVHSHSLMILSSLVIFLPLLRMLTTTSLLVPSQEAQEWREETFLRTMERSLLMLEKPSMITVLVMSRPLLSETQPTPMLLSAKLMLRISQLRTSLP